MLMLDSLLIGGGAVAILFALGWRAGARKPGRRRPSTRPQLVAVHPGLGRATEPGRAKPVPGRIG